MQVRGDGSFGQIENIDMDSPVVGTTYTYTINHFSAGEAVEFMIIFSGLDEEDVPTIFGFVSDTIDANI